ncbi:MAG TPA: di-heme oxidoredictase family protein [Pyrinomonadaceae bacterium]|nr:di-heme oxidoredictase family protein [Pyrinomonadaceae bacterium]
MKLLKLAALATFALALLLPSALAPAVKSQSGATEAPTGFDNQTNGFTDQATFDEDRAAFEEQETVPEGLGPVYNAQSCAECHQNPVTGGVSQIVETRAGHSGPDGKFVNPPGGSLIQMRATDPRVQERVPDGPRIAFAGQNPSAGLTYQIGVMGHDGGQYGFITNGPLVAGEAQKRWPTFSPDGTKIAYHGSINGQWDIFVMTSDGRFLQRLTTGGGDDVHPAWSPDGTKIAFASRRTGNDEIFVMNADGTNPVNITNHAVSEDNQPAWSPDGAWITFARTTSTNTEIYKIASSGGGGFPATQLTANPGVEGRPFWSPDGAWIVFHRNEGGQADIYKMSASGGGEVKLTTAAGLDQFPAWSPSGTTIAFSSTRTGDYSLFVMNADGSGQTRISGNFSSRDLSPAWSPDAGETVRTFRGSLNTLGDGFVECIDDITFQIIANQQPAGMQGTFVRVPILEAEGCNPDVPSTCPTGIGRFGWKGSVASLLSFSALAYKGEMGITSPLQPTESTSLGRFVGFGSGFDPVPELEDPATPESPFGEDVEAFARFMRSTKAPPRDRSLVPNDANDPGSALFDQIGCAACHVRSITTAPPGTMVNGFTFTVPEALGNKIIHPFGDFMLHDIGTGDGIVEAGGEATRNKVRTAPLWGLRTRDRLMHDGGSSSPPSNGGSQSFTINEAILRHAGQATSVRNAYTALSEMQKRQLIKFLKSL